MNQKNEFHQDIGSKVSNWKSPENIKTSLATQEIKGRYCQLLQLDTSCAQDLMNAFSNAEDSLWTYLPYGPFATLSGYQDLIDTLTTSWQKNSFPYCIVSADNQNVLGISAYLRITPEAGSVEIGHLCFSPALQKTQAATEAIFLMIDTAFKLGYRRVEWKCNDLNQPSINAAMRYGFSYEGTFKQAQVVKGHNRDTAWFAILDTEWLALREGFLKWLSTDNFDQNGQQVLRLSTLTKAAKEAG
jgi:RimJ/RimL family protein N-acetyltransferase